MIYKIDKLPEGIQLSPWLKEKSSHYYLIQYFGISFYLPATKAVKKMLSIGNRKVSIGSNEEDALRDIVGALYLQIRDNILAGIEDDVKDEIFNRIGKIIANPIHQKVLNEAKRVEQLLNIPAEK